MNVNLDVFLKYKLRYVIIGLLFPANITRMKMNLKNMDEQAIDWVTWIKVLSFDLLLLELHNPNQPCCNCLIFLLIDAFYEANRPYMS